jgi:predicted ATP-binding protein involved in virulence
MLFHSIQIQNYRLYSDFGVKFRPGMNVVAGVNGSGKTSLLKAVREVMTGFTQLWPISGGVDGGTLQEPDVRIQVTSENGRFRFEPQYPASINASATAFGSECDWTLLRRSQANSIEWNGSFPGKPLAPGGHAAMQSETSTTLPVLAFYPAYRQWPGSVVNEMAAATQRESRTDGYHGWSEASSEVSVLLRWAIGKSLERLQLASERGPAPVAVNDDELAIVNAALVKVVEGVHGLRYDFARKALVVDWSERGRSPTLFDNLSDGQRVAIALVADIARRMCLLNPHLADRVTDETDGVVLIDELDIHLHPRWQRMMVVGLTKAFPKVQFIASTHSPQILSELAPEQIILLSDTEAIHPVASYGLDSSRVLEQIMGADSRPSKIEARLAELFQTIERNDFARAHGLLLGLTADTPGLPELVRAEMLLKRKEVLGR